MNFADVLSNVGAHAAVRARRGAEAARGAREAARDAQNAVDCANPDAPGLFAFINASLGDGSAAAGVHRRAACSLPLCMFQAYFLWMKGSAQFSCTACDAP
jgi:hypothetical protein